MFIKNYICKNKYVMNVKHFFTYTLQLAELFIFLFSTTVFAKSYETDAIHNAFRFVKIMGEWVA